MKPELQTKSYYNYRDCINYIEQKYKINTDDFFGRSQYLIDSKKKIDTKFNNTSWYNTRPIDANDIELRAINEYADLITQTPLRKSFWSSITDKFDYINNGSYFSLDKQDWEEAESWEQTIINHLFNEFDPDQTGRISFYVLW